MSRSDSLFSDVRRCIVCGESSVVHKHHIYPGYGRRDVSDQEGCWAYLCPYHHNMSSHGVHADRELDAFIRRECQRRWEKRDGLSGKDAHEAFRHVFGISYL